MRKLLIAFVLLTIFSAPLSASADEQKEGQCVIIHDSYIAHYINKFENGDFTAAYIAAGGEIRGGVWFEVRVTRGIGDCEFIYSYRLRNTSDTPLTVFWDTPSIVPQLVYLPVGAVEEFSFRWTGQPSADNRRNARIFTRVGDRASVAKEATLSGTKEHLWEKATGSSGVTILAPAEWVKK